MAKQKRNLTDKAREFILAAAGKGASNAEICRAVKVSETIWRRWLKENPELVDELHDARLPSLESVEAALYKRAIGYEYEETYTERKTLVDADGNELSVCEVRTRTTRKHLAPEVGAQTYILENRWPDRWKRPGNIEATGGKVAYIVQLPE